MNRLANHPKLTSNVINMLPRCRNCGSDSFEQKELKRTGMRVKGNRVIYVGREASSDVGFICLCCGKLLPAVDAIKISISPGFKTLFAKIKQDRPS